MTLNARITHEVGVRKIETPGRNLHFRGRNRLALART
jgi:hypothetical protein